MDDVGVDLDARHLPLRRLEAVGARGEGGPDEGDLAVERVARELGRVGGGRHRVARDRHEGRARADVVDVHPSVGDSERGGGGRLRRQDPEAPGECGDRERAVGGRPERGQPRRGRREECEREGGERRARGAGQERPELPDHPGGVGGVVDEPGRRPLDGERRASVLAEGVLDGLGDEAQDDRDAARRSLADRVGERLVLAGALGRAQVDVEADDAGAGALGATDHAGEVVVRDRLRRPEPGEGTVVDADHDDLRRRRQVHPPAEELERAGVEEAEEPGGGRGRRERSEDDPGDEAESHLPAPHRRDAGTARPRHDLRSRAGSSEGHR